MNQFFSRYNGQTWLLLVVLLLLLVTLLKPTFPVKQNIYNYVFVIDITQSMNARDYHVNGLSEDRLSFVKQSLQHTLQHLPCHSRVSIGLFTNKNMFMLFDPLEVCSHYAVIEASLMQIDWRMAWATNSHIARGLYTSIRDVSKIDSNPHLVFFTDGQQTPSGIKEPSFLLTAGLVKGLVIGVGNLQPVPIPKLDNNNNVAGFWQSKDADSLLNNNNENASGNYLSAVNEIDLQRLAGLTGLQYVHLETPQQLNKALQTDNPEHQEIVATDISWLLAISALLIFLFPYIGLTFRDNW